MENGWITHAGNALFDYESLKAAVEGSGIGWEAKFNADNQRKLTNWKYKWSSRSFSRFNRRFKHTYCKR